MVDEHHELNGLKEVVQPRRNRQKRRTTSTITTNKSTINGPLDKIPAIHPLISVWNSIPGDVSKSNKLFSYILNTTQSDLKLDLNDKFWDSDVYDRPTYRDDHNYFCDEDDKCTIGMINTNTAYGFRERLSGYRISNISGLEDVTTTSVVSSQSVR